MGGSLVVLWCVLAAAGWTVIAATGRAAEPLPQVALLAGTGSAYAVAHLISSRRPVLVPALVAAAVVILAALNPGIASGKPLAEPLGYGNANAALLVQGVVAAGLVAVAARRPPARLAAAAAVLVLAAATVPTRSSAGMVLATVVVATAAVAGWRTPGRTAVALAAAATFAVFLGTVALGMADAVRDGDAVDRAVDQTLSSRRTALWHDAIELTREAPLRGVGPGRFEDTSPVAQSDRDARWAHSMLLQIAAETGLPGVLLIGGVLAAAYVQLYRGGAPPGVRMLAAIGLTVLLTHAAIDYIAHFAAVPIAAAALVGAASGTPRDDRSTSSEASRAQDEADTGLPLIRPATSCRRGRARG